MTILQPNKKYKLIKFKNKVVLILIVLVLFAVSAYLWSTRDITESLTQANGYEFIKYSDEIFSIIVEPHNPNIKLAVIPGLDGKLYEKNNEILVKNYKSRLFNAILDDSKNLYAGYYLVSAVNASFIDKDGSPLGLVISNGHDYSSNEYWIEGQYSLGISELGDAKIIKGSEEAKGYNNVATGFGRFVNEGEFINLCEGADQKDDKSALGYYACSVSLARSTVAITTDNKLIFFVSSEKAKLSLEDAYNAMSKIAFDRGLKIQSALLFDGGLSPSIYSIGNHETPVGKGPIGSIIGVYVRE